MNYGQDAKAFESLYRSDEAIDSFASLEARIDFFEIACKKYGLKQAKFALRTDLFQPPEGAQMRLI